MNIVKQWREVLALDPCVAMNERHKGPARIRFDVEARTRQTVVLMPMTRDLASSRGRFEVVSRSLPHNVKAKTGWALVTPVNCDARIHCQRLVPMFDDLLEDCDSSADGHGGRGEMAKGLWRSSLTPKALRRFSPRLGAPNSQSMHS